MLAMTAAVVASALFASPSTIGPVVHRGESTVVEQPDLVEGAWLQFPGTKGERLERIEEDGRVIPVGLPAKLRGEHLRISPLQDGWTVAIARYVPKEPPGEECCHEIEEPEGEGGCCSEWAFAQHGPEGRWTTVQALPHSKGTLTWVSEPVERHGNIEIAWGERYSDDVRVASVPLGRRLGHVHLVGPLLKGETGEVAVSVEDGSLYDVGQYGPNVTTYEPSYIAERRLFGDGRLGTVHVLKGPLLKERGTYFIGPGGSELYLYSAGAFKLLVARRAPFASSFERPHLVLPRVTGSPEEQVAQSFNGRLLLPVEEEEGPAGHERIQAVTISPSGIPGHPRTIESQSGSSSRYFEGAVGDAGEWLVASTSWEGGPLWLHPYTPRCSYRERKIPLTPATASHEDPRVTLAVGRSGVFHLAWIDAKNELQTTSVVVICG